MTEELELLTRYHIYIGSRIYMKDAILEELYQKVEKTLREGKERERKEKDEQEKAQ